MRVLGTKTDAERQDEESKRLVRPSPKLKPPRYDRRRNRVDEGDDSDVDDSDDDLSLNYTKVADLESGIAVLARRSRRERKKQKQKKQKQKQPPQPKQPEKPPQPKQPEKPPQPKQPEKPPQPKQPEKERIKVVRKDTGRVVNVSPETLKDAPGEYREPKKEDLEQEQKKEEPKKPEEGAPEEAKEEPKKPEEGVPEEEPEKKEKPKTLAEELGIKAPKRSPPTEEESLEARRLILRTFPTNLALDLLTTRPKLHPKDITELARQHNTLAHAPVKNLDTYADSLSTYETDPNKVQPPKKWKKDGELVDFDTLSDDDKAEAYRQHQVAVVAASLGAESAIKRKLGEFTGSRITSDLSTVLSQSFFKKPNLGRVFSWAIKEDALGDMQEAKMSDGVVKKLLKKLPKKARTVAVTYFEAADYSSAQDRFIGSESGQINERSSASDVRKVLSKAEDFFRSRAEIYEKSGHTASAMFRQRLLDRLKVLAPRTYERVHQTETKKDRAKASPEEAKSLLESLKARTSSYDYRLVMAQGSDRLGIYHGIDPEENYPGPPPEGVFPRQGHLSDAERAKILASARVWLRDPSIKGQGEARFSSALDLAVYASPYASAVDPLTYNGLLARLIGDTKTASVQQSEEKVMAKLSVDVVLGTLDKCAAEIQVNHEAWGLNFAVARSLVNHLDKVADDFEVAAYGRDSLKRRQHEILAKVIQQDKDEPYMGAFETQHGLVQSDADEPYMDAFSDDQSSVMATGASSTGRKLVP